MTPDQFDALLDRACRGVASLTEAEELRTAVADLGADRDRYRAAWQSARARARLIPFGGNQVYDGTRWRPALQAYSVLRARLNCAEQQLADPALRARYYAEASTLLAGAERGPQDDYGIETALELLAGARCPRNRRGEGHKFGPSGCAYCGAAEVDGA